MINNHFCYIFILAGDLSSSILSFSKNIFDYDLLLIKTSVTGDPFFIFSSLNVNYR